MSTTAIFLPCRAGSTRVPEKNTRPFAGLEDGLLGVKLSQLARVRGVDQVIVDSNDPVVLELATARRARWSGHGDLVVTSRPDALGQSDTTTDALIAHALATVEADVMLWTHVTSPLAGPDVYEEALAAYRGRDPQRHDSLMTATSIQGFLWRDEVPLNYARTPIRWPRTQDIEAVWEVNSAVFIVATALGRQVGDRVGERPLLHPMSKIASLDVDWMDDFHIAEQAYAALARAEGPSTGSETVQ
jgi:CMP-N-acetylneuraminic acid synthetase